MLSKIVSCCPVGKALAQFVVRDSSFVGTVYPVVIVGPQTPIIKVLSYIGVYGRSRRTTVATVSTVRGVILHGWNMEAFILTAATI